MSICRFEDRLSGQARVLKGLRERITACHPEELPAAFSRIEAARLSGAWIALLLEYELGEWLEPALQRAEPLTSKSPHPRLTALVFDRMEVELPLQAERATDPAEEARVLALAPMLEREDYIRRIEQIRQWIVQGEVYQINATFPLQVAIQGTPLALYKNLANKHPVAHAAFIEDAGRSILSFSPELFLERRGQTLTTRPMKGTAPRAPNPAQDHALAASLLASPKNRAENLMIVDLLRNDLGRIAIPGSVSANPLFSLEQYPTVWTMTSTVKAQIEANTSFESILRALFPCGSVTGAPKIAAMKYIQKTESDMRGIYCGSLGWMAPDGDFSLNVAIRTLVIDEQGGTYHVGGGIVHDSDPQQEWEECHWKSRVLTSQPPQLIETMCASANGQIERLEEHLNRLTHSAGQLNYPCPARAEIKKAVQQSIVDARVASAAKLLAPQQNMRVRLLLDSSGRYSIETAPLAPLSAIPAVTLSSERLDSRQALLQHKTTYRPWYTNATQWLSTQTDYFDLLFFNEHDELCEGSRSNVYIFKNEEWLTPPRRCGLLGGAVRQYLLDTKQVREAILTREDLEQSDARIRLSNGLRGWFDVRYIAPSLLPGNFLP